MNKIQFTDGSEYTLPDISYKKFTDLLFEEGCSDIEYDRYCSQNNMLDLTELNNESVNDVTLIFEKNNRILKFKCIYDSENV